MSEISKEKEITNLREREKILNVLGNKLRLQILYLLLQIEEKINFNTIAAKLNVDRNKLAYHISLLKNNNLIHNEMRAEKHGGSFSYYGITERGKKTINLLEGIFKKEEKELQKII